MYASKLVYNENIWESVSGHAQAGVSVHKNFFGFEEWINNSFLKSKKLGYIDSFRAYRRDKKYDRIALFMYNPMDKNVYYVGNLYKVVQLKDADIQKYRDTLNQENWLGQIKRDFDKTTTLNNSNAFQSYSNCFNSNTIVGDTAQSFVLNIEYKKLEIFPEKINLTSRIPEINNRFRRLRKLYTIPAEWENIFS
jgi:hypothetical protein